MVLPLLVTACLAAILIGAMFALRDSENLKTGEALFARQFKASVLMIGTLGSMICVLATLLLAGSATPSLGELIWNIGLSLLPTVEGLIAYLGLSWVIAYRSPPVEARLDELLAVATALGGQRENLEATAAALVTINEQIERVDFAKIVEGTKKLAELDQHTPQIKSATSALRFLANAIKAINAAGEIRDVEALMQLLAQLDQHRT